MWSEADQRWARDRGVDLDTLGDQLRRLRRADETLEIDRPAVLGDGIEPLDIERFATVPVPTERLGTFIPASGAATRMFASLVKAHAAGVDSLSALDEAITAGRSDLIACRDAFLGRGGLAIGFGLEQASLGETLSAWLDDHAHHARPKGLVPLHRYADHTRTAVVEHLLEAAALAGPDAPVHFTVQPGTEDAFQAQREQASALLGGNAPALSCSIQHPSTDTVAATPEGEVFRLESGEPLLRPGGHGSLLRNLEAIGGDVVVVKNIDNVTRDENRDAVVSCRRALIGRLLELEREVHAWLRRLDDGADAEAAIAFALSMFGRSGEGQTPRDRARDALARPIRVAAVVRNEGQPGGGPFWVVEPDGSSTPQIMESAQIDRSDEVQAARFASATHFNPVDMALSLRAPDGTAYALGPLVDDRAWLRAPKTHGGRPLQALERPGLWNGAMAGWNTLFVEVPSWTFRPVKELRNLLDEGHRSPAL